MATSQKPGNGGHGQEAYDTETGKYVAESGITDEEIIEEINKGDQGFFGPGAKEYYDSLDEDGKKELIKNIQNEIRNQNTNTKMTERFKETDINDFFAWGKECLANWGYDPSTQKRYQVNDILRDPNGLGAFYNGYKGAGDYCFEFLKAARMGYDNYVAEFGQERADTYLFNTLNGPNWAAKNSREEFERRLKAFDEITSKFEAPRDCQVYRLLDENYIVSQFRDVLAGKGFDIIPEIRDKDGEDFKTDYDTIDRTKYSVQEIADALQDVIGYEVPGDDAPVSFGMDINHSHMLLAHQGDNEYKRIWIKYDVPKGTKMFFSDYTAESEGVFHRGISYYIKDVKIEKDPVVGKERVCLIYGIK